MNLSIWQKIGLSILIISFLALFIIVKASHTQAEFGSMFSLFTLFVYEWAAFGCLGLGAIILRQIGVIHSKKNSIYIFIGSCNLINVFFGSYLVSGGFTQAGFLQYWLLVCGTACLSFVIFIDILL